MRDHDDWLAEHGQEEPTEVTAAKVKRVAEKLSLTHLVEISGLYRVWVQYEGREFFVRVETGSVISMRSNDKDVWPGTVVYEAVYGFAVRAAASQ